MYLSKVILDTSKKETSFCFYDRGRFHSVIENCFNGDRQHPLWRLEKGKSGYELIVLSNDAPDFTALINKIGNGDPRIIDYDPFIDAVCETGKTFEFLISVNPVICKDGARIPLNLKKTGAHDYCADDWLKDRLENNGAELLKKEVVDSRTVNIKSGKGKIFKVTYRGVLKVTDQNKFRELLQKGLGHAKAYGCGLMSVLPC